MPLYVFNDWLIHDLSGEHGEQAQDTSYRLLKQIVSNRDRIAYKFGSSWVHKAFNLMTHTDVRVVSMSKYLHLEILFNLEISVIVHPAQIPPIPSLLIEVVPPDDLYLFETYFAASADALITKDKRLIGKLRAFQNSVTIIYRDEFLKDYL